MSDEIDSQLKWEKARASLLMLLANCLACAQIYDLIPADPLWRKIFLCLTAILSTYGFRAALSLPPPKKEQEK